MTSHDARLAQILLAPSQHSNYFALTAILEYDLAKQSNEQVSRVAKTADHPAKLPAYHCCPRPAFQPAGCHSCLWRKTTCVANTDVSRKDQQMLEFRLAKKLLKIKMHIIHLPVWILSRNALDTKSRPKKCAIIHYVCIVGSVLCSY